MCPIGATCIWDGTVETLQMEFGYWRLSNLSDEVYKCDTVENVTSCIGANSSDVLAVCRPGHEGPLCQVGTRRIAGPSTLALLILWSSPCRRQVCTEDDDTPVHYFQDGICQECPNVGDRIVVPTIIFCVLIFTIFSLLAIHENWIPQLDKASIQLRLFVHYSKETSRNLGLHAKLKIALAFMQVAATLDRTYDIGMPQNWFEWTKARVAL